jgi:hypothetical protein
MRRTMLALMLPALTLSRSASAEERWAILGHELGCWKVSGAAKMLAQEDPKFAGLHPFATPEQLVAELGKLGISARTERMDLNGFPLVTVTVDGKLQVRFISRRYCRDAPYDL